ncbi:soluble NSF attachment family protein [Gordonia sp. HY285]|uniref:soluble NSF attachment family protein n=1 Tax=Gordonia liuliyuniae TaxID=2911517 RepID=UPI001F23E76D|nr:soluble NSF attachment family protein [Gordonia liuliyuniae]MCF8608803.1 soluble NSF attachment family protein [Gordonia liuliyuniae]
MTGAGPMDEAVSELLDDLWMARHGDPRFGHEDFSQFPALIARADELDDLDLRFLTRLEASYAALWSGRTTDVLTLVAWLLQTMEAEGTALDMQDWQVEQFETTVVDLLDALVGVPELALGQVEALVADWARRVRGTAYYAPAVEAAVHGWIAVHRGDPAEAIRILDQCTDFTPPSGTCGPGTRATLASVYSAAGGYAQAQALSSADLDGDPSERCGFYPAETYGALIDGWGRDGRRDDVIRAAASLDETYGPVRVYHHVADALVALIRVDALERALPMALKYLDAVDECANLYAEAQLAAALSATLASAAAADPDTVVARRDGDGAPVLVSAAQLAEELADWVRLAGGRFDVRNASSWASSSFDEILALRTTGSSRNAGGRVKAVSERSAEELISGLTSFGSVSPRRSAHCADALRGRLGELDGRSLARARHMLAWDRRREDPQQAIADLRAVANETREAYASWSAQSELLAALLEVHGGDAPPETLLDWPDGDPTWSAGAQANFARLRAMAIAPFDGDRAVAAVNEGLAILDRVDRGEIALISDPDAVAAAVGSIDADAAAQRAVLHHLRADLVGELDTADPAADVDAALVAARRAVDLASDPDQAMAFRGGLVDALQLAAGVQAQTDLESALLLMAEAESHARFAQLGQVLNARMALASDAGDLDIARDDAERAVAVWTVEGDEHAADSSRFDLAHVMLMREEDPLAIVELVQPAVDAMAERGDLGAQMHGTQMLARAQSAAGRAGDAVASFTQVIDAYTGQAPIGLMGQLHGARAVELAELQRFGEALVDLDTAVDAYTQAGGAFEVGEALRTAALTAFFAGDHDRALAYLAHAEHTYEEIATSAPVDFERARLDFARADIIREREPERAETLLRDVAGRARAANWIGLLVPVLHLSAMHAVETDQQARARELVVEALRHAPDHPALLGLLAELD